MEALRSKRRTHAGLPHTATSRFCSGNAARYVTLAVFFESARGIKSGPLSLARNRPLWPPKMSVCWSTAAAQRRFFTSAHCRDDVTHEVDKTSCVGDKFFAAFKYSLNLVNHGF